MPRVIITGWRHGLRKISMTHSLQTHAELGLRAAKAVTDRVLDGERVTVELQALEAATALARELESLGAECTVGDGAGAG